MRLRNQKSLNQIPVNNTSKQVQQVFYNNQNEKQFPTQITKNNQKYHSQSQNQVDKNLREINKQKILQALKQRGFKIKTQFCKTQQPNNQSSNLLYNHNQSSQSYPLLDPKLQSEIFNYQTPEYIKEEQTHIQGSNYMRNSSYFINQNKFPSQQVYMAPYNYYVQRPYQPLYPHYNRQELLQRQILNPNRDYFQPHIVNYPQIYQYPPRYPQYRTNLYHEYPVQINEPIKLENQSLEKYKSPQPKKQTKPNEDQFRKLLIQTNIQNKLIKKLLKQNQQLSSSIKQQFSSNENNQQQQKMNNTQLPQNLNKNNPLQRYKNFIKESQQNPIIYMKNIEKKPQPIKIEQHDKNNICHSKQSALSRKYWQNSSNCLKNNQKQLSSSQTCLDTQKNKINQTPQDCQIDLFEEEYSNQIYLPEQQNDCQEINLFEQNTQKVGLKQKPSINVDLDENQYQQKSINKHTNKSQKMHQPSQNFQKDASKYIQPPKQILVFQPPPKPTGSHLYELISKPNATIQECIGIHLPQKQLQIPISAVSNIKIPYRKRHRKVLYPPLVQGGKPMMKRYFCSQDFINIRQNFKRMEMGQLNRDGQKITLKDMCKWHMCGISTMHKLYKSWLQDPLLTVHLQKHLRKEQLKPGKMKYGLTAKMANRLQIMNQLIKANPFWTKDQLVEQIQQRLSTALQPNTIRRLLDLGCYRKTKVQYDFKKRNTEEIIQQRYNYCKQYVKRANIYDVYFMNLSQFKLHKFNEREYGWARQGSNVNTQSPEFKKNCVNVFAIIGNAGHRNYDVKKGLYTQDEYKKVLDTFFQNIREGSRPRVLIVDFGEQHYEKDKISMIHNLCEKQKIDLDFLPICSQQLNPLSLYFKQIKTKLRSLPHKTEDMIYFNVMQILGKIGGSSVIKAFQQINRYVQQGLNRASF